MIPFFNLQSQEFACRFYFENIYIKQLSTSKNKEFNHARSSIVVKKKSQRITISITRKFVSCNFSMDQLDLIVLVDMIYHLIHICPKSVNG